MSIAYSHSGEHAGSVTDGLLLNWSLDPAFLVPFLAAVLYALGLLRYWRLGGRQFPWWRPVFFAVGVILAGVALLSPLDRLADYSFTFHMIQHQLLTMIAVPFMLLGGPFVPVIRGLPRWIRRRFFIPFARNWAVRLFLRVTTRPLVAFALFQVVLLAWHVPGNYDAALENEGLHYLEHFCFIITAIFFWWHLVRPYPFPSRLNYLLRMVMLAASVIPNNIIGAMITFADVAIYGYALRPGVFGMSVLEDQRLGGILMWVMGAMMHLGAISVLFIIYAYEEARKEPFHPDYVAPRSLDRKNS